MQHEPSSPETNQADAKPEESPQALQTQKSSGLPTNGRKRKYRLADLILFAVLLAFGTGTSVVMWWNPDLLGAPAKATKKQSKKSGKGPGNRGNRGGRRGGFDRSKLFQELDKNKDDKVAKKEAGNRWRFLQPADKNNDAIVTRKEFDSSPRRGRFGRGGGRKGKQKKSAGRTVNASRAVQSARLVRIRDDAEVLALSLNGLDRAYLLRAFQGDGDYVVHDRIDRTPVTITYNEKSDRVRAFGLPKGHKLTGPYLDIAFAGWAANSKKEGMLLRFAGREYFQESTNPLDEKNTTAFPYTEIKLERTTWEDWKRNHPATVIYIGYSEDARKLAKLLYGHKSERVNHYNTLGYALPFIPAGLMLVFILAKCLVVGIRGVTAPKPA